jgi:hypothetical protein
MRAIAAASKEYDIDPDLLYSVAEHESMKFHPDVVSMKRRSVDGAIGPMQLMPDTAKELGVDPTDLVENIFGGAYYLRQQLDAFGDEGLALGAYNAGPGRIRQYKGLPPFRETQRYVAMIQARRKQIGETRAMQEATTVPISPGIAQQDMRKMQAGGLPERGVGVAPGTTKAGYGAVRPEAVAPEYVGEVTPVQGTTVIPDRFEKLGARINLSDKPSLPEQTISSFYNSFLSIIPATQDRFSPVRMQAQAEAGGDVYQRFKQSLESAAVRSYRPDDPLATVWNLTKNGAEFIAEGVWEYGKAGARYSPVGRAASMFGVQGYSGIERLRDEPWQLMSNPEEAQKILNDHSDYVAHYEKAFTFMMPAPQTFADKSARMVGDIAGFITQLAAFRSATPATWAPSWRSAFAWEAHNMLNNGELGHGVAMHSALAAIGASPLLVKNPLGQRLMHKYGTIMEEMGFFAGLTALHGGDAEDIFLSSVGMGRAELLP